MLRQKIFTYLGEVIPKHPWKIVIVAITLAALSVVAAVTHLSLDADQDNLISENLAFHKRYKDFLREFGDQEYLYLVVEVDNNLAQAKKFTTEVAARLKQLPDIKEVTYKIDNPALEKSFLLLFDQDQLNNLNDFVTNGVFSIKNFAAFTSLNQLFQQINKEVSKPISSKDEEKLEIGFTFLDDLIVSLNSTIISDAAYESHLEKLFFEGEVFDPDGFLITKNKRFLLCLIMPAKNYETLEIIQGPLQEIRKVIAQIKLKFPEIKAGLTGRPVLAADEMTSSNQDMNLATILAIVAVGVIFIISFRSITRPALAMVSLLFGIAWTYGFVAIFIGTLNLLSIVFAIILVGASIEYAIHVVARYQEELVRERHIDAAVKKMLLAIGPADLTSAGTTAAAFGTLLFTNFKALSQLGLIAGLGIIFCLLAMLIVLPAMLVIRDRRHQDTPKPVLSPVFLPKIYEHSKLVLIIAIMFTVGLGYFARKTNFNFNLLELQAKGLESVIYERKLIDESDESSWFAISIVDSPQASAQLAQQYLALPNVKKVDEITDYVPLDQQQRMAIVKKMAPHFAELKPIIKQAQKTLLVAESNPKQLAETIYSVDESLANLEQQAFQAGRIDAVEELENFRQRLGDLQTNLRQSPNAGLQLRKFELAFFQDLQEKLELLASGMHPKPLKLAELPDALRSHFISSQERYAVYVTPKENIWDPEKLQSFVQDVRQIDPLALGTPIEVYESSNLMVRAFLISGILAFLVICLFTYLDFRSWKASLLACLPLLLGGVWMVSIMGLFGISFNLANFFAIPIIIGIGVDSGVHIIHRLRQEKTLEALGRATGTGVMLTAIANAVGFGMMMIAKHQGIASLGEIMVIGTVCTAIAALVVMPIVATKIVYSR
ncbi:MAG: MMPL family transporter [Pseudomonadota bacterium]